MEQIIKPFVIEAIDPFKKVVVSEIQKPVIREAQKPVQSYEPPLTRAEDETLYVAPIPPHNTDSDFFAARNWYPENKTWPKWIIVSKANRDCRVLVKSLDEEIQEIIYNPYGEEKAQREKFIQLYSKAIHRERGY